ncbi:MAG TPA: class I adenylate-forming enzyme family protein [Bryobacteraceae bacterium]|nr:class I adenylate-forming enzyme family protein [Bryobacteraceae bacterium]
MPFDPGSITELTTGRAWDRRQLWSNVSARIRRNQAGGLQPGDRLLLLAANTLEFFADLLAVWLDGATAVPVDASLTRFELDNLIAAAEPKLVVGGADDRFSSSANREPPEAHRGPILDNDALILFTSGSTGKPKGVVHTHRSLEARWHSLRQALGTESYQRTLCLLPVYFGHGLICNCLFPLLAGCDLYLAPAFTPDVLSQLGRFIDRHQITAMSSVPTVWRLALQLSRPPRQGSLRRVHCGSAPLSRDLWKRISEWAGGAEVVNSYGITETGSWLAGSLGAGEWQDGLVGYGWGTELRVLKTAQPPLPAIREAECAPGESGHVWVQTPALMKGYFRRDDLNSAAVSGGWFHTGDTGHKDDAGRLILDGRAVDEINKGGMKIQPQDVENAAEGYEHLSDVCAFAIPDQLYGQNLAIAFVLRDSRPEMLAQFYRWMESRLARHKLPAAWYQLESLPRSARGKVHRPTIASLCAERRPLNPAFLKS